MANRVFRYELEVETRQLISMPKGAKILSIEVRDETPQMFALIDTDNLGDFEHRVFRVVTTGERFNAEDSRFIGTVVIKGWYVAHVFEQLPFNAPEDPVQEKFAEERNENFMRSIALSGLIAV